MFGSVVGAALEAVGLRTVGVGDGVVEVVAGVGGGGGFISEVPGKSGALSKMLGRISSGRAKPDKGLNGCEASIPAAAASLLALWPNEGVAFVQSGQCQAPLGFLNKGSGRQDICHPASHVPPAPALACGLQKEHPVQSQSNILDGYTSSLELHLAQAGPGSVTS